MLPLFSPKDVFWGYAVIFLEIAIGKRGKCCPFFPKIFGIQCRGKCCPFLCEKGGNAAHFSPKIGIHAPLLQTGGNPALFPQNVWVCDLILENCYAKKGEMLPILSKTCWDTIWLSLFFTISLFQTRGKCCPCSQKMFLGVRFDSWNLLCKTGEMLPIFPKIIGIQFYFHSYSFLLCSKQGGAILPTLCPKKLRRAIWLLKPAMQNRGKCCPFFPAFWVYSATFALTHFFCSKTGGNAALFCSENLGVRFDSWNLLCKPGEMLPILCKQFGYTMWLRSYSFLCSKTGGNAALFFQKLLGCVIWLLKHTM